MPTIENTISSMEAAAMLDRSHKELLRDIRRTIEHLMELGNDGDDLRERKIALSPERYFIPTFFWNEQNRKFACFALTKLGCELLATRMTGAKGTFFAAAYLQRFHELEKELADTSSQLPELYPEELPEPQPELPQPEVTPAREQLRLMFQVTEETATRLDATESRLVDLEENARIDPGEYNFLSKRVKERVKSVGHGFGELSNQQKGLLFKDINGGVKRLGNVDCRSQLTRKVYQKVLDFVNDWEPSTATKSLIREMGTEQ